MPYVERTDEEIIAAWERFRDRDPAPDEPIVIVGSQPYTSGQLVEALKNHEEEIAKFGLEFVRELARQADEDPVTILDNSGRAEDNNCENCARCDQGDGCGEHQ